MKHHRKTESGQAAVILALAFVGLLAFSALAIDGGNAYLTRRNAQNAADAASMAGTRGLHQVLRVLEPDDPIMNEPDLHLRLLIVDAAQRNGVPDTDGDPADEFNDNVEAWYIDEDGEEMPVAPVGMVGLIPQAARGIAVTAHIPFDSFIAHIIGRDHMQATTTAGSIFTEQGGAVSSTIYANGNCDPNTLVLGGSWQYIEGGIHSNGDVHINGNMAEPSTYSGTLEYFSEALIQGAIIINPPDNQATQVPQNPLPVLFPIADYAPGGARAAAAGASYYSFTELKVKNSTLQARGLLDGDGNLKSGLYYAEHEFELNGSLTGYGVTFVSQGPFKLSGSNHILSNFEPELLIYAYSPGTPTCNENAIQISTSATQWYGLIYAPNGEVVMSMSDNSSLWGSIVANTVNLSGSEIEIHYDERVDPPVPPRVVLIW